jgi:carbon storage regulator CsrA
MLMFSRRIGERIVVGRIEVSVAEIHRSSVRLAILAPKDQSVARGEVFDAVAEANRLAATASVDEEALLCAAGADAEGGLAEMSQVSRLVPAARRPGGGT